MSKQGDNTLTSAWDIRRRKQLRRRKAYDQIFKHFGLITVISAGLLVLTLIGTILWRGAPAFMHHQVLLEIDLPAEAFEAAEPPAASQTAQSAIVFANYGPMIGQAMEATFPDVVDPEETRALRALISPGARARLRDLVLENPNWIGSRQNVWLPLSNKASKTLRADPKRQAGEDALWLTALQERGQIRQSFRTPMFQRGDSRSPEAAGVLGALTGSALTLLVCLLLSFPIGLASAVYLEEFAPKSRLIDLIEININNLAAVPSILFGLLGLAVFINVFHLPRATPLVGGMTLALMTLPTIIIAARSAIAAVPPSLSAAALSVGASPVQAVFHHVLPRAMPGVMTGTILAMAQALGETAPLLMIGMLAFIVDVPTDVTDVATALPAQIFLWAENPDRAFSENAAAAILVLLGLLLALNAFAVYLRNRFEDKR